MFGTTLNDFVAAIVLACAVVFVVALLTLFCAVVYSRGRAKRAIASRSRYLELLLSASEGENPAAPSRRKARREVADLAVHLLSNTIGEERQQLASWMLLGGFDQDAEDWMLSHSPSQRLRGAVLLLLCQGPAASERVIPLLREPHPRVRAGVARALGYIGTDSAVPAVMEAIESGELAPSVGMMSILRIYPRDTAPLERGLRSESATLRRVVAASVGILELQNLREPVEALLDDPEESVRMAVLETLARLGNYQSLVALQRWLECAIDDDERAAFERAIEHCSWSRENATLEFDHGGEHVE